MIKIRELKGRDWLVIILMGILLLIAALPTGFSSSGSGEKKAVTQDNSWSGGLWEDERKSSIRSTEAKLKEILEKMQGVGEAEVMITVKNNGSLSDSFSVEGVLVVAQGGGNIKVVQNIMDTVSALFQVEACNIRVYPMKESGVRK